jgi:hypothetical protein
VYRDIILLAGTPGQISANVTPLFLWNKPAPKIAREGSPRRSSAPTAADKARSNDKEMVMPLSVLM